MDLRKLEINNLFKDLVSEVDIYYTTMEVEGKSFNQAHYQHAIGFLSHWETQYYSNKSLTRPTLFRLPNKVDNSRNVYNSSKHDWLFDGDSIYIMLNCNIEFCVDTNKIWDAMNAFNLHFGDGDVRCISRQYNKSMYEKHTAFVNTREKLDEDTAVEPIYSKMSFPPSFKFNLVHSKKALVDYLHKTIAIVLCEIFKNRNGTISCSDNCFFINLDNIIYGNLGCPTSKLFDNVVITPNNNFCDSFYSKFMESDKVVIAFECLIKKYDTSFLTKLTGSRLTILCGNDLSLLEFDVPDNIKILDVVYGVHTEYNLNYSSVNEKSSNKYSKFDEVNFYNFVRKNAPIVEKLRFTTTLKQSDSISCLPHMKLGFCSTTIRELILTNLSLASFSVDLSGVNVPNLSFLIFSVKVLGHDLDKLHFSLEGAKNLCQFYFELSIDSSIKFYADRKVELFNLDLDPACPIETAKIIIKRMSDTHLCLNFFHNKPSRLFEAKHLHLYGFAAHNSPQSRIYVHKIQSQEDAQYEKIFRGCSYFGFLNGKLMTLVLIHKFDINSYSPLYTKSSLISWGEYPNTRLNYFIDKQALSEVKEIIVEAPSFREVKIYSGFFDGCTGVESVCLHDKLQLSGQFFTECPKIHTLYVCPKIHTVYIERIEIIKSFSLHNHSGSLRRLYINGDHLGDKVDIGDVYNAVVNLNCNNLVEANIKLKLADLVELKSPKIKRSKSVDKKNTTNLEKFKGLLRIFKNVQCFNFPKSFSQLENDDMSACLQIFENLKSITKDSYENEGSHSVISTLKGHENISLVSDRKLKDNPDFIHVAPCLCHTCLARLSYYFLIFAS